MTSLPFADLDDAAARFTACTLLRAEWTHQAHLAIGLWHVHRYGATDALTRLRTGIRRLNESHGTANTATGGYHETITRAYVQLLTAFLAAERANGALAETLARLLASPVADRDALLTFYSRDRLMSSDARAQWMEPDLRPLPSFVV